LTDFVIFALSSLGFGAGSEKIGSLLLNRFFVKPNFALIPFVIRIGVGWVFMTFLLTLCGFLGLLYAPLLWGIWIVWLLAGIWRMTEVRGSWFWRDGDVSRLGTWAKLFLFIFLLVCLGTVLTPETRHDTYDYHLSIPNHYLVYGKILEMPWHVFTYMPKNGEILYTLALSVGNDSVAKLIHFMFGCLCLAVTWRFVFDLIDKTYAWIAAFFVATLPLFSFMGTAAYIDLIRSFWELLSLYCLFRVWSDICLEEKRLYVFLSSLFAGMAIGTKYTAWLVFMGPYLVLLFLTLYVCFEKRKFVYVPGCLILIALPVFPWLALNWSWTGNPMFPFFPAIFGAHVPSAGDAYAFIRGHAPQAGDLSFLYIKERIVNLLIEGNTAVLLGLAAIVAMPFMGHPGGKPVFSKTLQAGLIGFVCLSFLLFVLGSNNMDGRFCFATLALLALPLTFIFSQLRNSEKNQAQWVRWILPVLLCLLFGNALWHRHIALVNLQESAIPRITEAQRTSFVERHFPTYPAVVWANENLPESAFVLGMGYPLHRKCIYGTKHGYIPFLEGVHAETPIEELVTVLQEAGVTHIVKPYPRTVYAVDWSQLEEEYLQPVYQYKTMTIYKFVSLSK
jgi:hypothetical protein